MTPTKFKPGNTLLDLTDFETCLVYGRLMYLNENVKHPAFLVNMRVSTIMRLIADGKLREAVYLDGNLDPVLEEEKYG